LTPQKGDQRVKYAFENQAADSKRGMTFAELADFVREAVNLPDLTGTEVIDVDYTFRGKIRSIRIYVDDMSNDY
jgi:hypothetical protein